MSLSDSLMENAVQKVNDDSLRENASNANGAGLGVRVSRKYDGVGLSDGRECQWCLDRECNNVTLQEAYEIGAFQRHPGCGCEIEYISEKGIITVQNQKGGWSFAGEVESRKKIGLEPEFYAEETLSRVQPYLTVRQEELIEAAKSGGAHSGCYQQAIQKPKKALENSIKGHVNEAEKHAWKIQHPELYMKKRDPNDPVQRKIAIHDWENHMRRNSEEAAIEISVWRKLYGH